MHRLAPLLAALEAQGMAALYDEIENPLVRVLARWRTSASPSTSPSCEALNTRLAEVPPARAELRRWSGAGLQPQLADPAAPDPLRRARPEPGKKTKTGFSTDAATLEKLRDQWPEFIDPLLQYREVEKLRSTYGEGLLAEVAPDGRIHATFNQTVARTGRLSSDQPNLHNIPVRSEEGGSSAGPSCPARLGAARRRLQPDRAALHRPPGRGPGPRSRRSPPGRTSTPPPPSRCSGSSRPT